MRRDIAFNAEGVTLRGWLYQPDGTPPPHPVVVMAHGLSAVKEQGLDRYAEVFRDAGLAAVVFDHRNFGASDGEPRQEIDPWAQIRDYRHAITFARTLPDLDHERIGVWGTSYSGGHVLVVAAIDRRVKCVVAQAPTISGFINASRRTRPDLIPRVLTRFDADRDARFKGEAPAMIPVVAEDANAPCALPGKEAYEFFTQSAELAPAWRNEITLRSAEMAREYEPGIYVPCISPTPLLMIVATADAYTLTDAPLMAYELALEPKKLLLIPGGHFSVYAEAFETASAAAAAWFAEHLAVRQPPTA